jgi:methionyl-tRNA formyltransferase
VVARQINGLSPFPGAWCEAPGGRVKMLNALAVPGEGAPGEVLAGLDIACGQGAVRVLRLQREGKRAMDADEFQRGAGWAPGIRLG